MQLLKKHVGIAAHTNDLRQSLVGQHNINVTAIHFPILPTIFHDTRNSRTFQAWKM